MSTITTPIAPAAIDPETKIYSVTFMVDKDVTADQLHEYMCLQVHEAEQLTPENSRKPIFIYDVGTVTDVTDTGNTNTQTG